VPIVLKSRFFKLLEPSGLIQACNGVALPLQRRSKNFEQNSKNSVSQIYHSVNIIILFFYVLEFEFCHINERSLIECRENISLHFTSLHSQALQPMQDLGGLKKPPPIIPISGPGPPVPGSQLLCILRHSINPSQVWPSCSSSALRLVQGNFLAWKS